MTTSEKRRARNEASRRCRARKKAREMGITLQEYESSKGHGESKSLRDIVVRSFNNKDVRSAVEEVIETARKPVACDTSTKFVGQDEDGKTYKVFLIPAGNNRAVVRYEMLSCITDNKPAYNVSEPMHVDKAKENLKSRVEKIKRKIEKSKSDD